MTVCHKEFVNDCVPPKIWNDSEVMIPFCSPNFISLAWKAKKLGKMGTVCSLCALCALPLRSLCAPCATPVQPSENPTVWTLFDHFVRGLFEIDLGYWSTGYRDTDPQNQKWVWDTDPQDTGILIHKIKNVFGILIHCFFLAILQRSLFFSEGR